ncbi:hypothetical protein [Pseudoxanthomonas sp. UTMC 1351]|uniref:hypothetical protein n=1 Tax=Pseudoxanthomonas sp. UTMC 1351 TaxID=2695853 RepID=UPI0034CE9B15
MTFESATAETSTQDIGPRTILLWSGAAALLAGLVIHRSWEQWHSGRAGELLLIAGVLLGFAALVAKLMRWSLASSMALLWIVALLWFAGLLPTSATVIFVIAAVAVGGMVLPREHVALQGLLGGALFSAVVGWLLPLPLHHGWIYACVCVAAIAYRYRALEQAFRAARHQWADAVALAPRAAGFAVTALGLASTACWLPTLQFDDLAYHLRLPWELQDQGFYSLDPRFQIWALAPWASDVLHAIPQLISGSEARGAVNAFWLMATAAGVWRLASRMGSPAAACWLSVALVASIPLTAPLAGGMQTELPTAAALAWTAAMVMDPKTRELRWWLALAMLIGLLIAVKLTAAAMAGVLLLWALVRHPWPSVPRILIVMVMAAFIAAPSYVYALAVSGNPVLPLFNGWFQSDYFPLTNRIDPRWHAGFNLRLPWDMTFDTDRYLEAYDGGGGFLLIALAGAWLLGLFYKHTRALSVIATAIFLLPLLQMQYLRYAYPGLVLLSPALVAAAFHRSSRYSTWLVVGLCVLNFLFQSNSHWMLRTGALKASVKSLGKDSPLLEHYAPERLLAAAIRDKAPASGNVLLLELSKPYFAELGTRGRSPAWYAPGLQTDADVADRDISGSAWVELLGRHGVDEVILYPQKLSPAQAEALRSLRATKRMSVGDAEWWSLPTRPENPVR